jgi:hypothetical protein
MKSNYNVFLDDYRNPSDVTWVTLPSVNWMIIRSYDAFVDIITKKGRLPEFVAYDHDLADSHYNVFHSIDENGRLTIDYDKFNEKTGYDCAKWLVDYCMEKGIKHPPYTVHSMNPVGAKNIISYVESYNKTV